MFQHPLNEYAPSLRDAAFEKQEYHDFVNMLRALDQIFSEYMEWKRQSKDSLDLKKADYCEDLRKKLIKLLESKDFRQQ